MKNKIESIDSKLDKVLDSLTGDDLGNKGIIPTQKEHSDRIEKLELNCITTKVKTKTKERTIIAIISFISSAIALIGSLIFK